MGEIINAQTKGHDRYLSLDVLRGMTIALMVVVNTPGSWSTIYAPFRHAAWHGFTITDLVFPSFLFVVGNAMSFSVRKTGSANDKAFLQKALKRSLIIFLIGLFLNAYPFVTLGEAGNLVLKDLTALRIFGVLQRIALCYCLASLVLYYTHTKGAISFTAIALLGYWAIMFFFGEGPDPYSLEGNAALKFDLWLINPANLYKGEGIPFDPEGILSTFPATVNVLAGYYAGKLIQQGGNTKATVRKLIYIGALLVTVALLWHLVFPINKKIWTSPFVLLTTGINSIVIGILINTVEIMGLRRWTYFFEVFGKNPLVLYALSGMIVKTMSLIRVNGVDLKSWLYDNLFLTFLDPNNASLLYALVYMTVIWLIGYVMDRRKVYIKV